jgi:hypothetical protein
VAIVSYNHELAFGFMAEPNAMPDVGRMRDFAAEVFDEMVALATKKGVRSERGFRSDAKIRRSRIEANQPNARE